MGLLNVYKFSNTIVPHLSNRFCVTFFAANNEQYAEELTTFNVKSVEMPTYSIDSDDTRVRFGNTQFVIPVINFSKTELKITFIETDSFKVTKFLGTIIGEQYYSIDNIPQIKIKIDELTYGMDDVIASHIYVVRLLSFDQPTFTAGSKDIMEVSAKFFVEYELNSLSDSIDHENRTKAETVVVKVPPAPVKEESAENTEATAGNLEAINPATSGTGRRIMSDTEMAEWDKKFKAAGNKGSVEMSAADYLDYKYTKEQKIKNEIEADIAKNGTNSNFTKHVGANGEVYYSVKSGVYKNKEGKTVTRNLNRNDNDNSKFDDIMMHTTGGFFDSASAATGSMASGGESMVLFSDFALVKEEALYNGRAYAATGSTDNIDPAVANNTFGVERNSGSGIYNDGTVHFVGTNIKISGGESGDWKTELAKQGVDVAKTNATGSKDKQYGMSLTSKEADVMAAVLYDTNKNGSSNFNFNNSSVYMPETRSDVKNNKLTASQMQGTVLTSHDAVSSGTGKHGEMGKGNLEQLQDQLSTRMAEMNKKKIKNDYEISF